MGITPEGPIGPTDMQKEGDVRSEGFGETGKADIRGGADDVRNVGYHTAFEARKADTKIGDEVSPLSS